jgi:hypothetical protein
MWKKFVVLAVFAFGFVLATRTNAGTEVVRDYSDSAATYNYAPPPPPRPVYYAPPPPVNFVVFPAYGYYGPRYRVYGGHRFYVRRDHWRSHRY